MSFNRKISKGALRNTNRAIANMLNNSGRMYCINLDKRKRYLCQITIDILYYILQIIYIQFNTEVFVNYYYH